MPNARHAEEANDELGCTNLREDWNVNESLVSTDTIKSTVNMERKPTQIAVMENVSPNDVSIEDKKYSYSALKLRIAGLPLVGSNREACCRGK